MVIPGNIWVDSGLSSLFCLVWVATVMASSFSRPTYSWGRQLKLFCYFLCAVSEIFCYHQWPVTVLCSIAVSRTCTYECSYNTHAIPQLGKAIQICINFELSHLVQVLLLEIFTALWRFREEILFTCSVTVNILQYGFNNSGPYPWWENYSTSNTSFIQNRTKTGRDQLNCHHHGPSFTWVLYRGKQRC